MKTIFAKTSTLTAAFLSVALSSPLASADEWTRQVGVTGFLFGMEGEAGAKGVTADVDLSISDVVSDLDAAFTLYTDGTNGTWGYWGSFEYLKLKDETSKLLSATEFGPGVSATVGFQSEVTIIDGGLTYNVSERVELLAGIRHWNLDNQISGDVTLANTELRSVNVSDKQRVTDGFIGARMIMPINDSWSTMLRFDIGAGDSDSTLQAIAMANYHINDNWTSSFGYRYLSLDYQQDDFVFDMANEGFEIAVLYKL